MKRLFIYVSTVIALSGCLNDSDDGSCPVTRENDEIKVSAVLANVEPATRTAIDGTGKASWANGDVLGLFCPQAKPSAGANVDFTVSGLPGSPVWTPSTTLYWGDGTTQHTFLAYAPYASGNTSAASVKLPALTPQTGTISPAQDFLISNAYGTTGIARPANGTVGLTFTHAFALIQFQIAINASIATGATLQSVTFAGGASDKVYASDATSTIALASGTITPGTTVNTLTLTPSSAPTLSTTATNFFVIILPGTYATTLQMVISEGGTSITIPAASISSTAFAAATKYTYTVNISRTAITLSNPVITDWTAVASGTVNGGI